MHITDIKINKAKKQKGKISLKKENKKLEKII